MRTPGAEYPRTAVVLAGGLGTRLSRVVNDRPKVLAAAAGRPFLYYVLWHLAQQGLQRVILSTGYMAEQVAQAGSQLAGQLANELGNPPGEGVLQVECVAEPAALGTAGGLRLASAGLSAPFFALNGDTLFLASLPDLWQAHSERRVAATVALLPVENGAGRGCVSLDAAGYIRTFNEKPEAPGPALVNAGVYVLEPQALANVPPAVAVSIERQVFPELARGGQLGGQVQRAYFADIGTPESLAAFEQDVRLGQVPGLDGQAGER